VESLLNKIDISSSPNHVAIIMDGNGRWAKMRNKPRTFGHRNAVDSVQAAIRACNQLKISHLTLFAFSTENWSRPNSEINMLFKLLHNTLKKDLKEFYENEIRLKIIGNQSRIPKIIKDSLDEVVEKSKNNKRGTLIVAIDYGSKEELVSSTKKIATLVKENKLDIEDITESVIENNLYTEGIPPVDLLIRTSGEKRISNFLLWQIAYAEIYFTNTLWPDFREKDFYQAIIDYQLRERRFGSLSKVE
jgi:undecaprenyl diphosphate synthase